MIKFFKSKSGKHWARIKAKNGTSLLVTKMYSEKKTLVKYLNSLAGVLFEKWIAE